jgi:hypothetical protein
MLQNIRRVSGQNTTGFPVIGSRLISVLDLKRLPFGISVISSKKKEIAVSARKLIATRFLIYVWGIQAVAVSASFRS